MKRNEKETNGNKWKGNEDQVNFSTCLKVRFSFIVFIWFCFFCSFLFVWMKDMCLLNNYFVGVSIMVCVAKLVSKSV